VRGPRSNFLELQVFSFVLFFRKLNRKFLVFLVFSRTLIAMGIDVYHLLNYTSLLVLVQIHACVSTLNHGLASGKQEVSTRGTPSG